MSIGERRIKLCADIISYITGMSYKDAKKLVIGTHVGQALLDDNKTYLYDQGTANVYDIIKELDSEYDDIKEKFTVESIVDAYQKCI